MQLSCHFIQRDKDGELKFPRRPGVSALRKITLFPALTGQVDSPTRQSSTLAGCLTRPRRRDAENSKSVNDASHALDQVIDIEINEQPNGLLGQTQVREHLRGMNRQ